MILETSSDTLRAEYRSIKVQLESSQTELTAARSTIQSLERERQECLNTLLSKEAELDRLNGIASIDARNLIIW